MSNLYTLADGRTVCFENIDSISEIKENETQCSFEVTTVTGNVYVVAARSGRLGFKGISSTDIHQDRSTLIAYWNKYLESEK